MCFNLIIVSGCVFSFFICFSFIIDFFIVACVSFNKKSNNNAQGGQSRVNPTPVNSAESNSTYAARTVPNGSHVQPQNYGKLDEDMYVFKNWFLSAWLCR